MKINSISSINYNNNTASFKHTAVPYPEYESVKNKTSESGISAFIKKVSALFTPEVTKEASEIKSGIDNIYSKKTCDYTPKETKGQLLKVFA